jgi:glutaredoxin
VHLHLSLSDGACQVWGGHLEPGTLVLKGADLLVGFIAAADPAPVVAEPMERPTALPAEPRVEIAVASGCPWSARALRLLRTLGIPHQVLLVDGAAERQELARLSGHSGVPQVFIDGQWIGGYDALAELHGQGALEILRG